MDTELTKENRLLTGQALILEMIAKGAPLQDSLDAIVRFVEAQRRDLVCGILIVADDGKHFRRGSGPNLPQAYHNALDGVPIASPYLVPCSEATHRSTSISVADVANDGRWYLEWRELVLSSGLRLCLSTPVKADDGRALASFATYGTERHDPHPVPPDTIEIATHLTALALERHRENVTNHSEVVGVGRSWELIEALPAAVYTTDGEGRITSYNETAAALWGNRPELRSDNSKWCGSWKIYRPDGMPLPLDDCPMAVTLKERRPVRNIEIVVERPDGARLSVLPFPTPLFDADGRLTGAVNMLIDLSDLKRMEQLVGRRVHEQAALYRLTDRLYRAGPMSDGYEAAMDAILATLRCSRASILLFDDTGVMRFVAWRGLSDEYRRAVEGHSPWKPGDRDAEPISIVDIETADEPEVLKATVRREGIKALSFIPIFSDGVVIGKFMAYYEMPHAFTQDEIDVALNIARQLGFNIEKNRSEAARLRAEAELRESQEQLQQILDSASEYAIITLNGEGGITSWSEGAVRLLGFEESDAIGKTGHIFFTPEDGAAGIPEQEMAKARQEGRATNERWHVRKDGSRFWGSGVMLPLEHQAQQGYLKIFRDRTEERMAEERQQLLVNELNHRVKNTLATVQSITKQTLRSGVAEKEVREALDSRLSALARSHDVLTQESWEGARLRDVVTRAIEPFATGEGEAEKFLIDGPYVRLSPKAALSAGMGFHELATNASKYGALTTPSGRVIIRWTLEHVDGEKVVRLVWHERNGPPVSPPKRKGFGTRLIERAMAYDLKGKMNLEFAHDGLRFEMILPYKETNP